MRTSRRSILAAGVAAPLVVGLSAPSANASVPYLVGAGRADMTGAVAGHAMMGYSEPEQVARGILQRCWARAYIVVDQSTGNRVVFVTADVACLFQSVHLGVMAGLERQFGGLYTEHNVNLNATHTHASCGGTAWDLAYTLAANGFKKQSYDAEVNGIVEAISRAHRSLAPGTVRLGRGELHNASANRSREAFDRNPAEDTALFPNRIDPAVTVLRFSQGGKDIGAITWFATHGTSLTDHNFYIAGDNKGYASYRWEQDQRGFVAAFPQTNAGDMTPNLNVRKMHPSGPTEDHRLNCAIIGDRQFHAGRTAFTAARPMTRTGVDSVTRYVDMANVAVDGMWTTDGRPARTSPAIMGAGAVATSQEDNWVLPVPGFTEGMVTPEMRDSQAPKVPVVPLGLMPPVPWVPQILPIQILRIGDLVLAASAGEYTVVAGLRVRRAVARALGVPLENVLMQGYANGYSQYVTTPEEYLSQQYEGGETLFGRWTLPAYLQEFDRLARAMAAKHNLGRGPAPLDKSGFLPDLAAPVPADVPFAGLPFGGVLRQPPATAKPGETVSADFVGAHPNTKLRNGDTYLEVQREVAGTWKRLYNDNDWCTEFHWERPPGSDAASLVRVSWTIPKGATGLHRLTYTGDARNPAGVVTPISGASTPFTVR